MKNKSVYYVISCLALAAGLMSCWEDKAPYDPLPPPEATNIESVKTLAPVHVTTGTADLSGSYILSGDAQVFERGIYITLGSNPLAPQPGNESVVSGTKYLGEIRDGNDFTVSLTGLKSNTKYRYSAFVTTIGGTAYGEVRTLVTSYGTVVDAEGNEYQTVMIGDQTWMRENLRSTLYNDKSAISGIFKTDNDLVHGLHYTFSAANRSVPGAKTGISAGACPTGWHVPTDAEFKKLLTYVGVPANQISLGLFGDNQAIQLKDGCPGNWANSMIENSTGFSVLPAGICNPDEGDECIQTAFWTSTPNIYYGFQADSEKLFRGDDEPNCTCGISVRCIKDF